ncbi:DUF6777 domain-containing protein [Streptomyces sp. STR69]|uniref:DUF6777 domain-containing protein n=1 Tax=Streptomyces sp. STR69 TaxID=1796942 RepID=UPI0021C8D007|nr:DUF6777 domain-containing protein [Streptomyces sp. STR69]
MRTSTGTIATACALSAALLVAGCGGDGARGMKSSGQATKSRGEVFLQPVAAQGPDPFTDSTAVAPSAPPRVTRTPQSPPTRPAPSWPPPTRTASPVHTQAVSGATPGLYGGTARSGSCDVERQIAYLTRDQAKAGAFAQAEGISRSAIPGYLRGLTSVVLRADTQVTNHGFRDARVTGFQSVLQAGTAVLLDNRGVPRVRCACGNPLKAGVAGGNSGSSGRGWSGYRPAEVVVVTPAPQVITHITIINIVDNTWIERPLGHRGPHHDHVVPPPVHVPPTRPGTTPAPHASTSPRPHDSHSGTASSGTSTPSSGTGTAPSTSSSASPGQSPGASPSASPTVPPSASPSDGSAFPGDGRSAAPDKSTTPCTTPTVTLPPGATGGAAARLPSPGATGCPTATVTAAPRTVAPQPSRDQGSPDEIGPPTVPETPDRPDGGGLIPDGTTSSVFGSPTDVFGG